MIRDYLFPALLFFPDRLSFGTRDVMLASHKSHDYRFSFARFKSFAGGPGLPVQTLFDSEDKESQVLWY